jgi:hypothetical protein
MEPSVQGFISSFKARLSEPDGPARLQGTPVAPPPGAPPDSAQARAGGAP